jgi:sulfur-oxidizing protein SoxY
MSASFAPPLEPSEPAPPGARSGPEAGRRQTLRLLASMLLAYGAWPRGAAHAAPNEALAFAAGSLNEVLRALEAAPVPDSQISLVVPDSVENGALVPVEVTTELQGPQTIFVLSEANPFPLVVRFFIPAGTDPFISTRIKVAQSCNIHALVEANGRFHSAVKATKVSVGGCGA